MAHLTKKSILAAVAALAVLVLLAVWLVSPGGIVPRYVLLRTYTGDAAGLAVGSTVRVNGITVGYLDKLLLTNSRNLTRKVELDMRIKPSVIPDIPVDSTAGVTATSLVGDNYVNIVEGSSPRHVQPGDELASRLPANTDEMMAQMQHVLQRFDALAGRFNALLQGVQSGQGTLGKWVSGKNAFADVQTELQGLENDISNGRGTLSLLSSGDLDRQMQSVTDRYHAVLARYQAGQGTAGQISPLFRDANAAMQDMNSVVTEMQGASGPSARFNALSGQFDQIEGKVDSLLNRIQSGEGTLGQLTVNPRFSDALDQSIRQLQQLAAGLEKNPRKFLAFQVRVF